LAGNACSVRSKAVIQSSVMIAAPAASRVTRPSARRVPASTPSRRGQSWRRRSLGPWRRAALAFLHGTDAHRGRALPLGVRLRLGIKRLNNTSNFVDMAARHEELNRDPASRGRGLVRDAVQLLPPPHSDKAWTQKMADQGIRLLPEAQYAGGLRQAHRGRDREVAQGGERSQDHTRLITATRS
jgi:hypothetical protein